MKPRFQWSGQAAAAGHVSTFAVTLTLFALALAAPSVAHAAEEASPPLGAPQEAPSLDTRLTAVTGPATIEPDSVILRGAIGPHWLATNFWIEYGLTTNYESWNRGNHPPSLMIPTPTPAEVVVSVALWELTPNTVYHYRITAENAEGTASGEDETFTTPAAEPLPYIPHRPTTATTPQQPTHRFTKPCPFTLVITARDDVSGNHKHIHATVSRHAVTWHPSASAEICTVSGVDTNGTHWHLSGHPQGARHRFALGAHLKIVVITARLGGPPLTTTAAA